MSQSTFDKLNLRPQERRIVVGVGVLIFIIVNIWFVWPRFKDWGEVKAQIAKTQSTLDRYQKEVAKKSRYESELKTLESEGSQVLTEELQLDRIIASQASATGLILNQSSRVGRNAGGTNQFFEEQAQSISYSAGPAALVNFLVKLATDNSMMRVRELSVQPDPTQTRYSGTMMIIASFQRKPQTTSAPRAVPPGTSGAKAPSGRTNAATRTNSTTRTNMPASGKAQPAVNTKK